jgi:hypothetical protein
MERMGLKLEGAADSGAVATEGLDHLADGPTWFAAGTGPGAAHLRALDRGAAVLAMAGSSKALH